MINTIFQTLKSCRIDTSDEKITQTKIEEQFISAGINFKREYKLSTKHIVDFFIPEFGIAIEVKVRGGAKDIYRQLNNYCTYENVCQLILITSKSMGLPETINNKPVYVLNLAKAWL